LGIIAGLMLEKAYQVKPMTRASPSTTNRAAPPEVSFLMGSEGWLFILKN